MSSIFSVLSRYAHRQEENYLTEAFVYLIELLLERSPESGLKLLDKLCGERTKGWFSNHEEITIKTQVTVEEGRPDIEIRVADDKLVFIEVKHDSRLSTNQLEAYHSSLQKSSVHNKQLVILTRSRNTVQDTNLQQDLFHHICWYELSGWLSESVIQNEVCEHYIDSFIDFLKEKEMSMEKITWDYIEGVPALINLVNMIGTAISEVAPESNVKKTAGWSWIGYYLEDDLFIGTRYTEPLIVVFENNRGVDPTYKRELKLEEAYFFSLNAGEQLESLIDFLSISYKQQNK